ncbi:mitogen-activated protein kinase 15-like protein, partial [Tanacetum coccineum]
MRTLRRQGVKTEILRILVGQVTTLASMADVSFFRSLACLSLQNNCRLQRFLGFYPDIVEIKRIMLLPSRREFKDIYVVFEFMESDLHHLIFSSFQYIKSVNLVVLMANASWVFNPQLSKIRSLRVSCVSSRNVQGADKVSSSNFKPSRIMLQQDGIGLLSYADLFIRNFEYTPVVDIWGIGYIFTELLNGKPLFPGKSVVHQLELITGLLRTPSPDTISRVRNDKDFISVVTLMLFFVMDSESKDSRVQKRQDL